MCEHCEKVIKWKTNYRRHLKTCTFKMNNGEKRNIDGNPKLIKIETKFPCDLCDFQATGKGHLIKHKNAIHEGEKYICDLCDYQAVDKRSLRKHQLSLHDTLKTGRRNTKSAHGGKTYLCDSCSYQTPNKGHLNKHQRSIHQGERYPCDSCQYQAPEKGSLSRHEKTKHENKKSNLKSTAEFDKDKFYANEVEKFQKEQDRLENGSSNGSK